MAEQKVIRSVAEMVVQKVAQMVWMLDSLMVGHWDSQSVGLKAYPWVAMLGYSTATGEVATMVVMMAVVKGK